MSTTLEPSARDVRRYKEVVKRGRNVPAPSLNARSARADSGPAKSRPSEQADEQSFDSVSAGPTPVSAAAAQWVAMTSGKLIEAVKKRREVEVELTLTSGEHLVGRLVEAQMGRDPAGYRFSLRTEEGQVVHFTTGEVQRDSLVTRVQAVRRPPVPDGVQTASQLASADGILYLSHGTSLAGLLRKIQRGAIPASESRVPDGAYIAQPGAYMEAFGKNSVGKSLQTFDGRNIRLVFSVKQFDQPGYIVNRGWAYGVVTAETAQAGDLDALHKIFWDLVNGFQSGNEVVFSNDVPLGENLRFILVEPGIKEQLVSVLESAGFVAPGSVPLSEFVREEIGWPDTPV